MAIIKLAPNVPQRLAIKYIDAVPPNDPKYGPQARIKTEESDLLYLPGKASDAFTELYKNGVISEIPTTLPTVPGEKLIAVPIRSGVKEITVTLEQAAGEQHGKVRIANGNGNNGAPPAPATPAAHQPDPRETGARPANAAPASAEGAARTPYFNALYADIMQFVSGEIVPMVQNGSGIRMTAEAIVAATATLYIAETKYGAR